MIVIWPLLASTRRQKAGPIICIAAVEPHRGANNHPVAVMLDFVDPARAGRRS